MPSVMKVRSKNAAASWYSRVALPVRTAVMSAANSDCWNVPSSTSGWGTATSRQGFMRLSPVARLSTQTGCLALCSGLTPARRADSMAVQVVISSL